MLERVVDIPRAIRDINAAHLVTLYGVWRADMVSCPHMLTMWHTGHLASSVRRVINHWREIVDEIEAGTKVVLNILASCSRAGKAIQLRPVRNRNCLGNAYHGLPLHRTSNLKFNGGSTDDGGRPKSCYVYCSFSVCINHQLIL